MHNLAKLMVNNENGAKRKVRSTKYLQKESEEVS